MVANKDLQVNGGLTLAVLGQLVLFFAFSGCQLLIELACGLETKMEYFLSPDEELLLLCELRKSWMRLRMSPMV